MEDCGNPYTAEMRAGLLAMTVKPPAGSAAPAGKVKSAPPASKAHLNSPRVLDFQELMHIIAQVQCRRPRQH